MLDLNEITQNGQMTNNERLENLERLAGLMADMRRHYRMTDSVIKEMGQLVWANRLHEIEKEIDNLLNELGVKNG